LCLSGGFRVFGFWLRVEKAHSGPAGENIFGCKILEDNLFQKGAGFSGNFNGFFAVFDYGSYRWQARFGCR
jgi:hypothetical protein